MTVAQPMTLNEFSDSSSSSKCFSSTVSSFASSLSSAVASSSSSSSKQKKTQNKALKVKLPSLQHRKKRGKDVSRSTYIHRKDLKRLKSHQMLQDDYMKSILEGTSNDTRAETNEIPESGKYGYFISAFSILLGCSIFDLHRWCE